MKIFCQECGGKHEFATASSKPKFCSECGNPFNPIAQAAKKKAQVVEEFEEEEEEEDDEIKIPKNIRVSIEGVKNWDADSLSFKSVMGTSSRSEKHYRRPASQEIIQRAKTKERAGSIDINI